MPNAVKYKTGNLTGSLQKGNVALGVSGSLGPTSTAGWYNGPNVVANKYQIFETAASGDPDVYCPQDDNELIKFARWKGATGANTGSAAAVLAWIGTQTNLMAANFQYESIVTDGLIFNLDAGFVGSYPTTGTTWYDLSGNNNNGTLYNGPTFNSANSGSIVFDGVDDYSTSFISSPGSNFTISFWFNVISFGSGERQIFMPGGGDQASVSIVNSRIGSWNGNSYRYSPTVLSTNTWYNFVMTNSTNTIFYLNGNLDSTYASTGNFNTGTATFSAAFGGASRFLNAYFSNVCVYNKTLSAAEVLQNYNAQRGRFGL